MKTTAENFNTLIQGLNEQQKQAVMNTVDCCTKIVAGAGTGKTKIISKRFVKLVNDLIENDVENPVERLLVITFTDKAANEMKERIFQELSCFGRDFSGQDFWISTYHSFCSRILKRHSIEVGLSPSMQMGEEKQLKNIFDNIIKKIKYSEVNSIKNSAQIASSIGLNVDILSINNIKKLSRINDLDLIFEDIFNVIKKIKSLGIDAKEFYEKTTISTKRYSEVLERTPFGFSVKEDYIYEWEKHFAEYADDFCKFEDIVVNSKGKNEDKGAFNAVANAKLILSKNGSKKPSLWSFAEGFPENIKKTEELELYLIKVIALIYAFYQNELETIDLVDFDDLINKTVQLLKQNEVIRAYYQKIFKHIIIDEFQDTNGAQLELVKLLMNEKSPNITFVGDRKQSIYGFRFAQMENLEVLHKHIQVKYKQKFVPITLVTNYRSTPHVLRPVNFVTKNCLNLDEELEHNPDRIFEAENKFVKTTIFSGVVDSYSHKIAEAKYIASEIIRVRDEQKADFKEFAVLVKSHSQANLIEKYLTDSGIPSVKRVNTDFFDDAVIRNVFAAFAFLSNRRDEIALVRLLKIQLSDKEIYEFKLNLDEKILQLKQIDELKKMNFADKIGFLKEKNIFEKLDISIDTKQYVNKIFETIQDIFYHKNNLSLLQVYYKLVDQIQPYCGLEGIDKYKAEYNLKVFEKIVADFIQNRNYCGIKNFLDYLDSIKDDKSFELPSLVQKDVNAVQLLTIHASKGLEFPYVFVTNVKANSKSDNDGGNISFDLQFGNKPGFGLIINKIGKKANPKTLLYKELWKKPREKNEAIRLFYVALTRAEKYLNILTFEPYQNCKPADYSQNFPSFVGENIISI